MPFKTADVEKEYEKDEQLKRDDVKSLMEWVEKQPHLPNPTELEAIIFLVSCRYDVEVAKEVFDNFFTLYNLYHDDFFAVPDVSTVEDALKKTFVQVLPEKSSDGCTIALIKLLDHDPTNFDMQNLIKFSIMVMLLQLFQNGANTGLVIVFDFEGLGFGHLIRINPAILRKIFHFIQVACPLWIKNIHLINMSGISSRFVGLMRPFVKKEFYNLFVFHSTELNTVYEYVPQWCFPKDMGGSAPSLAELTELQAILFLHSCHYDQAMAKETIVNYYKIRTDHSSMFRPRPPSTIRHVFSSFVTFILPRKSPEGYTLQFCKYVNSDASLSASSEENLVVAQRVLDDHYVRYGLSEGHITIFDVDGFTFGHLVKLNLSTLKTLLQYTQEALPVRVKGIHFMNSGVIFNHAMKLITPFISKKFQEQIYAHTTMESFFKFIPKECLPSDYGGDQPPIFALKERAIQSLIECEDYFHWLYSQKITRNNTRRSSFMDFFRNFN